MNPESTKEKYGPERGRWYKCIKDVFLNGDPTSDLLFKKGKIYKSENTGYLTREDGIPSFYMWSESVFPKFFEKYRVGRKKRKK